MSALISVDSFRIRALVADTQSEDAAVLKHDFPPVDLVKADQSDKAGMVEAMQGCYAAFVVRLCSVFYTDLFADGSPVIPHS